MQPQQIDLRYLTSTTRARIYLLWAILVILGFVATHMYQQHAINALWFILSVIGLGHMYKTMPLGVGQMRRIFAAWLIPITLGMIISGAVFYIHTPESAQLLGHLGAFWMLVMGTGFVLNGIVDAPSGWYWFAAILNITAGIACFFIDDLLSVQYLIAAIVSGWSMLNLWLFRS